MIAAATSAAVVTAAQGGSFNDVITAAGIAALAAGASYGIGQALPDPSTLSAYVAKTVAHTVVGGLRSELSGGRFCDGALGALAAQLATPAISQVPGEGDLGKAFRTIIAAAVGGAVSESMGGDFGAGALSAAYTWLFNHESIEPDTLNLPEIVVTLESSNIDEIVFDMAMQIGRATRLDPKNKQRERGGDITPNGNGKFSYNSIETGSTGEVPVKVSKDAVAWFHTHTKGASVDPYTKQNELHNQDLSLDDVDLIKVINTHVGRQIPAYLGTPDGSIIKFSPHNNYRKGATIYGPGTINY